MTYFSDEKQSSLTTICEDLYTLTISYLHYKKIVLLRRAKNAAIGLQLY